MCELSTEQAERSKNYADIICNSSLVEYLERAVAQEGDVDVVAERRRPQRVAEGRRPVPGPADDRVPEEQLWMK